jgi:hypothetical protein
MPDRVYSIVEDGAEIATLASLYGAAHLWAECPETRTVNQVMPSVGTIIRTIPAYELKEALNPKI